MQGKLVLFLVLLLTTNFLFSQQTTVSIDVKETPLIDVLERLEKENGLLFSYAQIDVEKIKISIQAKEESLHPFLKRLLDNQDFSFEIVDSTFIILTKKEIQKEKEKSLTNLSGQVLDKLTLSPLPFSNIYIKNSSNGVFSDKKGNFTIAVSIPSTDSLIISYLGYQEQSFSVLDFSKSVNTIILLDFKVLDEDFIIVRDYLTDGIELGDNGISTIISPSRTGVLPGQIEVDVLTTIQFLPGISSPDNTSSGLYIRGGTPDQNLILWDDIPIYHSAHYFGLISAFNPYIIDKIKVYRSGFSAQYGGRISGVIDLQTDSQLEKKDAQFSGGIGSNMTHASVYGRVPFGKNKTTATFSVRRSLTDFWTSPTYKNLTNKALQSITLGKFNSISEFDTLPYVSFNNNFHFFDSNIKIATKINDKNDLSISALYSQNDFLNLFEDRFNPVLIIEQTDSFYLENKGLNISFNHHWNSRLTSQVKGLISDYNYDYKNTQFRPSAPPNPMQPVLRTMNDTITKYSAIKEKQIQIKNTYQTKKENTLNFGYQLTHYAVNSLYTDNRNKTRPEPETNQNTKDENIDRKQMLQTLFSELIISNQKKLSTTAGIRFNYYSGTNKVYIEPRINLNYKLDKQLDLQVNLGRYYQFLNGIIKNNPRGGVFISNPIWTLLEGSEKKGVTNSNQIQAGLLYHKNSWVIDLQAYYKVTQNIATNSIGFDLLPTDGAELGKANIKGLDLLVKKRWRNYHSWLSYSLGKVDYTFTTISDRSFASPFDQRHSLNWTNLYSYKKWDFALGWSWVSGTPYTIIEDFNIIEPSPDNPQVEIEEIYGKINSNYLKYQHHLDISISYTILPKESLNWKGIIGFSIFNVYNKENIYSTSYYVDDTKLPFTIQQRQQKALPFTPNLVFRLEFN